MTAAPYPRIASFQCSRSSFDLSALPGARDGQPAPPGASIGPAVHDRREKNIFGLFFQIAVFSRKDHPHLRNPFDQMSI